jgi:recombination protein RecA
MSQALRKITGALNQTKTTMIFINQLREKVGVMFGSPETTSGGKALKFYASVRLDIRRIETLKDGTDAVGNRTRVKVVKNKMSPPFKVAEFDILYGTGISREGSLIDLGVEQGIVRKSGAWYTYEGDQLGQGKENARNFLRDNPDLANEIEKRIKEKLGVGPRVDADTSASASANGSASPSNSSPSNSSPSNSSPSNSSSSASNPGNGSSTSPRPAGNGAAPSRTAATAPGVTV